MYWEQYAFLEGVTSHCMRLPSSREALPIHLSLIIVPWISIGCWTCIPMYACKGNSIAKGIHIQLHKGKIQYTHGIQVGQGYSVGCSLEYTQSLRTCKVLHLQISIATLFESTLFDLYTMHVLYVLCAIYGYALFIEIWFHIIIWCISTPLHHSTMYIYCLKVQQRPTAPVTLIEESYISLFSVNLHADLTLKEKCSFPRSY